MTAVMDYNISPNGNSKKSDLSISFDFDIDKVLSDNSSDSETTDLQIDVSEIDDNVPPCKHRREAIEEISVFNKMEEEIERQLDAKAAKTNLTATNVKNILKHVITNEHVMAMVNKHLNHSTNTNIEDITIFEPKLTRAKAKELAEAQCGMPWPITPIKKPSSEVQVLIDQELFEDSSDEEYNPEQDNQNDSTKVPQPIPKNLLDAQQQSKTIVQYDPEGIFKIPGIPDFPMEKEEGIGQRTRSKLSLSETPLEQIEQSFIPPDITTDMYDWGCEVDEDWDNFLKEFTRPLTHDPIIEDDTEADPEYNILEDEETDLLDKEELRADKAVKVTRKELNNLIAELFEFNDIFSNEQEDSIPKKKKSTDNPLTTIENHSMNNSMIDINPTTLEPEVPELVNFEQRQLLAIQFRQHVQFMAQHFVMTYMHPVFHSQAKTCKENLNSLRYLSNGPNSAFNSENLSEAMKLVSDWENKCGDTKFLGEYTKFIENDNAVVARMIPKKSYDSTPKFHDEIVKLFLESKALMYPQLLPHVPFHVDHGKSRVPFNKFEDQLIAIGLEQFIPFVASQPRKFKGKKAQILYSVQLIKQYLLPCKDSKGIMNNIHKRRQGKESNPIKHYFEKGFAPRTIHYISLECELIAPKDQAKHLLPVIWQQDDDPKVKIDETRPKYIINSNRNPARSMKIQKNFKVYPIVPKNSPLRNPIINMLPKILPPPSKTDETVDVASNDPVSDKASPELPQLRRTTPRLAKTKSAQNMKLMAQVLGSKSLSNCPGVKSKGKIEVQKDAEPSTSTKVDDEEEIAELMLASTTIKKDMSRKKAQQAREMENIKRVLQSENSVNQDERDTKFAASYMQKLHSTVEPNNPETFRAVIKLYLNYNEKMEKIVRSSDNTNTEEIEDSNRDNEIVQDSLAVSLYKNVCRQLKDYPELCSEFLLFLKPHQAAIIGKSVEYMKLKRMTEFLNVAQVYFTKQPSRLAKIMQAIAQLASDPYVTLGKVHTIMNQILKGHQLVMDLFLQLLPTGKPPESVLAPHLFENLNCPLGPHDRNKVYSEDAPELYENIDLPILSTQEDPYGGDNCKCNCHNSNSGNLKSTTEHCVSCGTRYLNGKIYLQTLEGLRPGKITFPGSVEEKLENMARISLKTTDKSTPTGATKKRRKSTKTDSHSEESCGSKTSPIKETEEGAKCKKGSKSPSKSGESKKLKRTRSGDDIRLENKCKRERRYEKKETKIKSHKDNDEVEINLDVTSELPIETEFIKVEDNRYAYESINLQSDKKIGDRIDEIQSKGHLESNFITTEMNSMLNEEWSREEDMILLQSIKKEYSDHSFSIVGKKLNRPIDQVKERWCTLLSLLEQMN